MSRPKLIITADDYGMSPWFNQGMLEAARAGLITGISVMIKRKYIRKADLLRLDIPLGLHLELETSTSSREIVSQIERFRKRFDRLPAYLDGHQHQHLSLANIRRVARIAKHFEIPVRSRFPDDRIFLRQHDIVTPDNFISWHPSRIPILEEKMRKTLHLPVSELVVHPGYYDKQCHYRYNTEREEEFKFLCSSQFKKLIRDFQPIRYTDIMNNDRYVRRSVIPKKGSGRKASA